MKAPEIETQLYELEQTTAVLGLIQIALAEGHNAPDSETADAIYLLYNRQSQLLKQIKSIMSKKQIKS